MITKKKKREDLQYLRDEVLDAYISRPAFQYDANGDALYRHYKDQYTKLGKDTMTDTMGQAAALTGGYRTGDGSVSLIARTKNRPLS